MMGVRRVRYTCDDLAIVLGGFCRIKLLDMFKPFATPARTLRYDANICDSLETRWQIKLQNSRKLVTSQ